ncbi:MAG: ATP synthase F1 subunit delta [Deltaproteobacteria bacterium]|jgi:F-type H+-transporting ATPase subunit delta|nr:ATP synthase F1 subunit delta [Deltaproteobacteria bacterium]
MNRGSRAARRYARALLELGDGEPARLAAWGEELGRLAETFEAAELRAVVFSPELSQERRLGLLARVSELLGLSYPVRSLAAVAARHGRLAEMGAIADAYAALLDQMLGRTRARLSFAQAPSDREVQEVVRALERLTGKTVLATVALDPALVGGVVAEVEGKIYDASLAGMLAEAERRLAG